MRSLVIRAGNVFGFNPAIRFDAVVNAMALQASTEGAVTLHGDGSQSRPFIDVEDLAWAVTETLQTEVASGTYNLATHNASIGEVAELIGLHTLGCERTYLHRDARMRNVQVMLPTKLGEMIQLLPKSFGESIRNLVDATGP